MLNMDKLINSLKETYGYTNYDLALVKYALVSIASELSKIMILFLFYFIINKVSVFITFMLLLSFLRFNSGGFHCKHYLTCFFLTFVISFLAIIVLPSIYKPNYLIIELSTIICLFINYYIGPIASPFRPSPGSLLLKHCKNNSFVVIFIFFIIVSISNSHKAIYPLLLVGFWTIILHTVQMIFAKILLIKGG